MIRLGGLVSQKAFGKFEMGKVISNPFANAFVNEAEGEDHEVSMANNSIDTIIKMATELKAKMGEDEKQIPAWIQDHIAKAENLISQASGNYHEYGDSNESVVNEDNTAFETLMLIRNLEQTNKLLAQDLKTSKRLPNDKKENIKKSIVVNQGLINYYKETYKNLKNNESVNEAAPCWKGYKQVGMKDKGGRQVPNCVPNESVNEASNTGEKIQNLNNRIKALKDKMAATKSSEQKNLIQQRLKNALQTLSNYKKQNISKESVVKEATYNFGKEEYTKKNLTPTQIQDLAFGYVQTPITKLVGKTLGHRVNLANDLARLTGTKQLDAKARGKEAALIMVLLKNKLISKEEYIQMYKDLIEKHQQVIKYLRNASPEMRNSGGAARAAAKDMKGEFDMD